MTVETPFPISYEDLLRNRQQAEDFIQDKIDKLKESGWWQWLMDEYNRESAADPDQAYPSQGLRSTEYDGYDIKQSAELSQEVLEQTIHAWLYYLELYNHPDRLKSLLEVNQQEFKAPKAHLHPVFLLARFLKQAIAINELGLEVGSTDQERIKRTERFKHGPFVKLGEQARSPFVGSANPDVWGGVPAVASMVMSHCLCGVPRDGVFSNAEQQADFARKVFEWIDRSPVLLDRSPEESQELKDLWQHNVMGVLEAEPTKAIARAKVLYDAGIRTFRIYSPEPGNGPLNTLKQLRALETKNNWQPIEIFVGQVTSVKQAQDLEKAKATGLYIGIGGGGRCITGVRSGVVINWPQLVWKLRGKIKIPIIVEGGGSDAVAQTFAVGVTGIGVTRAAGGGTIESPGGKRYFENSDGKQFKPYRGEASAGMKDMGGRTGPFGIIPYVEGEATVAWMEYGRANLPTILQKLYYLFGDAVLAMVFQGVDSIPEVQKQGAKSIVKVTAAEQSLRNTH